MKLYYTILAVAVSIAATGISYAQKSALNKEQKKEIDVSVKRDLKQFKSDGWAVMPGTPSLERQIKNSKYTEADVDAAGNKIYLRGTNKSVGSSYDAARKVANDKSTEELAANVNNRFLSFLKSHAATAGISDAELTLINGIVSKNRKALASGLTGIETIMEMYRRHDNGMYEVIMLLCVDSDRAMKTTRDIVSGILRTDNPALAEKFASITF